MGKERGKVRTVNEDRVLLIDGDKISAGMIKAHLERAFLLADVFELPKLARQEFLLHPEKYSLVVLNQTLNKKAEKCIEEILRIRGNIAIVFICGEFELIDQAWLQSMGVEILDLAKYRLELFVRAVRIAYTKAELRTVLQENLYPKNCKLAWIPRGAAA